MSSGSRKCAIKKAAATAPSHESHGATTVRRQPLRRRAYRVEAPVDHDSHPVPLFQRSTRNHSRATYECNECQVRDCVLYLESDASGRFGLIDHRGLSVSLAQAIAAGDRPIKTRLCCPQGGRGSVSPRACPLPHSVPDVLVRTLWCCWRTARPFMVVRLAWDPLPAPSPSPHHRSLTLPHLLVCHCPLYLGLILHVSFLMTCTFIQRVACT